MVITKWLKINVKKCLTKLSRKESMFVFLSTLYWWSSWKPIKVNGRKVFPILAEPLLLLGSIHFKILNFGAIFRWVELILPWETIMKVSFLKKERKWVCWRRSIQYIEIFLSRSTEKNLKWWGRRKIIVMTSIILSLRFNYPRIHTARNKIPI